MTMQVSRARGTQWYVVEQSLRKGGAEALCLGFWSRTETRGPAALLACVMMPLRDVSVCVR